VMVSPLSGHRLPWMRKTRFEPLLRTSTTSCTKPPFFIV
jgi:hypothetical protein